MAGEVTAGLAESNVAAYSWVYGFGHTQADCRAPGSAQEHYARFEYGITQYPHSNFTNQLTDRNYANHQKWYVEYMIRMFIFDQSIYSNI